MVTVDGLRTGEAARMIGVSEQTIRAFVRTGKLRGATTALGVLIDEDDAHRVAAERGRAGRERPKRATSRVEGAAP